MIEMETGEVIGSANGNSTAIQFASSRMIQLPREVTNYLSFQSLEALHPPS